MPQVNGTDNRRESWESCSQNVLHCSYTEKKVALEPSIVGDKMVLYYMVGVYYCHKKFIVSLI